MSNRGADRVRPAASHAHVGPLTAVTDLKRAGPSFHGLTLLDERVVLAKGVRLDPTVRVGLVLLDVIVLPPILALHDDRLVALDIHLTTTAPHGDDGHGDVDAAESG